MTAAQIPDLDARRRALDPARSFIVQAPAGSGKTELLIQRYLRLLAYVEHPEEIVAVTFTRKAASEMRERVLQALADAKDDNQRVASRHEQLTLELAAAALRRNADAGWCIAENPARMHIQTIDSLCAALTRQMPLLSRFGSQPESIEDASALYLEAARATVALVESDDGVAHDIERVLAHLDNDVKRIEDLLADMLKRRDHWLRHVHGRERAELEAALMSVRREVVQCARALMPEALHDELIALARYAAINLAAEGRSSPLSACAQLAALPGTDDSDVELWCGIVELLVTRNAGDWRRRHDVRHGFPTGESKAEKETAQRWKDRALALIASLATGDGICAALHELRFLPPARYSEDQWEVLGAILRLLPRAVAQLNLVFGSRGQVDFTEVAQAALRALETDEGPTDLALALDYRIRHLLIDEFQDTSISQYQLIEKLTAGWEPGDGRSVFAVGDPMQSIYRFREAQVGLFLRARAAGIAGVELQPIALTANFRSQAGIVEWVNHTFSRILPTREVVATGAVPYTASIATQSTLNGESVCVHPFLNDDGSSEAAQVAAIVAQAQREEPDAKVAILVRSRGHLREIVPQLKNAGLRFRALDIEELGHRPVVQDLVALTRALAHPADRLAWLAVLRAPWCGLTLADLHALAGDDHDQTVLDLMNDDARVATLSAGGRERLSRVHAVLRTCLEQRCRNSLRERVAGTWLALGGPACVEDTTDLEDAEIYFEYLEAHDEAGEIADLGEFEAGLAKLYALPDLMADERLQIMTIHKAKGLEFDIVIVPGLGRASRSDDKKLFLWMERPREDGRETADLLLAPIQETGAHSDAIYAWLQKIEAEKESLEAGRLLYVAATRAKQRLHLLGGARLVPDRNGVLELKAAGSKTLLGKLWPVVAPIYTDAAKRALESPEPLMRGNTAPSGPSVDQSLLRLASGWQLSPAPPRAAWVPPPDMAHAQDDIEFSWAGETARHVGSVVHRWLQRFADDALRGWNAQRVAGLHASFRAELAARGVPENELAGAGARVAAALTHAVTDARGRWLLGPQHEACNERRITTVIDGERINLVIDRMFRDADGKRWIVDYKTSIHEGADVETFLDREHERYRAQLARYAAAVGGAQATMLGLYFPLLVGWREWSAP